jgi:hypothetical protein
MRSKLFGPSLPYALRLPLPRAACLFLLSFVPLASARPAFSLGIHETPIRDPPPLRKSARGVLGDARADFDMP